MKRGKFEKYHRHHPGNRHPTHYWRLIAGNGEIIAQGEGYTSAAMRDKGIRSVRRNALIAKVVEV